MKPEKQQNTHTVKWVIFSGFLFLLFPDKMRIQHPQITDKLHYTYCQVSKLSHGTYKLQLSDSEFKTL